MNKAQVLTNREKINGNIQIDNLSIMTIRKILIERLSNKFQRIENLTGKADPLNRTSLRRWYLLLNELADEGLIAFKDNDIPLWIEIKLVSKEVN